MVDATSFSSSYSFFNGFFNLPDTWNYDFKKNKKQKLDYLILFSFSMLNKRLLSYNDVVIGPSAARAQNHTATATR